MTMAMGIHPVDEKDKAWFNNNLFDDVKGTDIFWYKMYGRTEEEKQRFFDWLGKARKENIKFSLDYMG